MRSALTARAWVQVDKADNQLCGATYIELYKARPFPQPKHPIPPRPAPT